jgi:hypothetical protein
VAEVGAQKKEPAAAQRGQAQPSSLGASTIQWMAELPQHIRPNEVATRFPHVANILASSWPNPERCRGYFDEVLLDRRGDRRGFPERVAMELAALKNHYDSVVFPTHQTVWDEIVTRSRA